MSKNQQTTLSKPVINTNTFMSAPVQGVDFSASIREDFHLERGENNEVIVVSDGFTDYQKQIDSEQKNAGLVNILKFQEMRYGSIQNAIIANEQKKLYADVSIIPETIGEQAELVAKTNAEVDRLCKELGVTKEQLLNLTTEQYIKIKQDQAAAAAAAAAGNEGGNE